MTIPAIWAECFASEPYAKTTFIFSIASFSFAQVCLLALATLERKFQWVFYSALVSIFALALLISEMIVFETGNEWLIRIAGVLGILDGCTTLMIPVLYKLSKKPVKRMEEGPFREIDLQCPRCGHRGMFLVGAIVCEKCSLSIRIEIDEEANVPVS